jgi:hypothetical protein
LVGNCNYKIKHGGQYTGTCVLTSVGSSQHSTTVSGQLKTNAKCQISGFMSVPGFANSTVQGGVLRGTKAVFTAVRGDPAIQVRVVTLFKN